MGVQNLQNFLEAGHVEGGAVQVELLKIARNFRPKNQNRNKPNNKKLSLVVDSECCLDRLYGGYFSDWVCGGQWNRMYQYLSQFLSSCENGHIEVSFAFNGSLEPQRMKDWIQKQLKNKAKANQVIRHLHSKGTPPPKVWWISPVFLSTALRMALRHCNVTVMCSMDDHHQEVLAYCRENNLHGIVGDDAEYIVFDPPRYFSATNIKLTRKGFIETKEFLVEELAKGLELSREQLCIVAALLGNYLLTEAQLNQLHNKIGVNPSKNPLELTVRGVAQYVKSLEYCVDNLDVLANQIFGSVNDKNDKKKTAFIQTVQYYLNGTKQGFLKFKPRTGIDKKQSRTENNTTNLTDNNTTTKTTPPGTSTDNSTDCDNSTNSSRFASETVESEAGSLAAYKLATEQQNLHQAASSANDAVDDGVDDSRHNGQQQQQQVNGNAAASSGSSSNTTSPSRLQESGGKDQSELNAKIPQVPQEVYKTACERHQKGQMSPYIYQILTHGEIKLPILLEDDNSRDMASIHHVYRPVRQSVYAILFNLHHQMYIAKLDSDGGALTANKTDNADQTEKVVSSSTLKASKSSEIVVREWIWSSSNQYHQPEPVQAEPVGWSVPTVQRLWFGTKVDDMRRRLRAYLTCMKSDSPLMVCSSYVPQHLVIMASVLRYLMQCKPAIIRKCELDAFIVTAFSPDLMNTVHTQDLQLQGLTVRGVQLATLFMQGVEMALMANDACGAPIPWLVCCPWLYFDGKLFHYILAKTELVKSLQELCNHKLDILVKVERMRHAILENLTVQFARRPLPIPAMGYSPMPAPPPSIEHINVRRGGAVRRPVSTSGGQLEVAGMVVGSWGPNYSLGRFASQVNNMRPGAGYHQPHHDRLGYPTYNHRMNVGRGGGGGSGGGNGGYHGQSGGNRRRPGNNTQQKKFRTKRREPRGRGITDDDDDDNNRQNEKVGEEIGNSNNEEPVEQYESTPPTTTATSSSVEPETSTLG